jgi:hypothetical protein
MGLLMDGHFHHIGSSVELMRLKGRPFTALEIAFTLSGAVSCGGGGASSAGSPDGGHPRQDASVLAPEGGQRDGSSGSDTAFAPDGEPPQPDDSGGADAAPDGGPPQDDGSSGTDASTQVQGQLAGQPCGANGECASGMCSGGVCADATSCLTLLQANPALPTREYEIDPDGPGNGLAPFVVYCDMTTDGGGWTTLPLRFSDSNYWSITQTGSPCIVVDIQDNSGNYRQYQSTNAGVFAYTHMEFTPPIAATSVRFVNFLYTNGGMTNTMDFEIGGLPTLANTSYEGWYFANRAQADAAVGYAFPDLASCTAPYRVENTSTCSRDYLTQMGNAPTAPFFMNETVPLTATVANFDMGLIQGCASFPVNPPATGEQFHIETPQAADGVWIAGIAVR